jgi:PleD family two-component response regulator
VDCWQRGPGISFSFSVPLLPGQKRDAETTVRRGTKIRGASVEVTELVLTTKVERPLVSVVDDDESVRESLPDLLREFAFAVRAFASAEEFLTSDCVAKTRCLILDIAMPGMTGPDLQHKLKRRRREIPIVFITAHADVCSASLDRGGSR